MCKYNTIWYNFNQLWLVICVYTFLKCDWLQSRLFYVNALMVCLKVHTYSRFIGLGLGARYGASEVAVPVIYAKCSSLLRLVYTPASQSVRSYLGRSCYCCCCFTVNWDRHCHIVRLSALTQRTQRRSLYWSDLGLCFKAALRKDLCCAVELLLLLDKVSLFKYCAQYCQTP